MKKTICLLAPIACLGLTGCGRKKLLVVQVLPNGIVWDVPYVIEGLTYRTVRWNPVKIEPANIDEIIKEKEPLKKVVRQSPKGHTVTTFEFSL